jgi:colanic acid/amylovoran biosynthesis protein
MNLFVKGVQFRNKGAHLMLQAVREETERWPMNVSLAVSPRTGTWQQRRAASVMDHAWFESRRIAAVGPVSAALASVLPGTMRRRLRWVADKDIAGVLDASGFSYSDQWGAAGVERMVYRCRWWKRRGVPIVLLPQAYGPFSTARIRSAFRELATLSDLVYVRDETSARHVAELVDDPTKLRDAPDFTSLVKGKIRPSHASTAGRPCIIPNYRMVDKTEGPTAAAYVEFLVACTQRILDARLEPFVLIHDHGKDQELVATLEQRLGHRIQTVVEDDPVHVKGVVGQASFVIGSRFHGLVSALTQGVPCIGTSWSHKYEELFASFGMELMLVGAETMSSADTARFVMDIILDSPERQRLSERALGVARDQRTQVQAMWSEVRTLLGVPSASSAVAAVGAE